MLTTGEGPSPTPRIRLVHHGQFVVGQPGARVRIVKHVDVGAGPAERQPGVAQQRSQPRFCAIVALQAGRGAALHKGGRIENLEAALLDEDAQGPGERAGGRIIPPHGVRALGPGRRDAG